MTATPLDLGGFVAADKIRSSPHHMRACLREVATRGADVWVADLSKLVPALIEVARVDLCLARLVEGHADALRIIAQADGHPRDGVYGVWASRSVGTGVTAANVEGGWQPTGELRFASGVDLIDRALVPAWLDRARHGDLGHHERPVRRPGHRRSRCAPSPTGLHGWQGRFHSQHPASTTR